ncbi:hypothetical protein [Muricoccus vinaceus]|uniref:Uncharacterized protein n=1 Tax=Muricoccus vinaceus TaxID=424704 RepID=A0ABV6IT42_9PROT
MERARNRIHDEVIYEHPESIGHTETETAENDASLEGVDVSQWLTPLSDEDIDAWADHSASLGMFENAYSEDLLEITDKEELAVLRRLLSF